MRLLKFTSSQHFNPRSPRGGATGSFAALAAAVAISIHAPHEGERRGALPPWLRRLRFQSTLPTRGSDHYGKRFSSCYSLFQSTLPTRGSDAGLDQHVTKANYHFNPRSPRGGATLQQDQGRQKQQAISIHAPHEGERRKMARLYVEGIEISIHAPHEGERQWGALRLRARQGISIHAPHEGERRKKGGKRK